MMNRIRRSTLVAAVFAALAGGTLMTAPAASADAGSDVTVQVATMNVQAGAAARSAPYAEPWSFIGWVSSDGWRNPNGQWSWVECWVDAGPATGNYFSHRWFLAYVNYGGGSAPVWAYVHSSYVTSQSSVRNCNS
jgi:hypothetical protein